MDLKSNINLSNFSVRGVLGIQNYGCSGTTLLHSLLDGHTELLCLPCLDGTFYYTFWLDQGHENCSKDKCIEKFFKSQRHWFDPEVKDQSGLALDQMGENRDEKLIVSETIFRESLKDILFYLGEFNRKNFLIGIYVAYAVALGRELKPNMLVVYPCHSQAIERMNMLFEDFDEKYIAHMVREPLANMGSTIKYVMHHKRLVNPMEAMSAYILNDHLYHWGNPHKIYGEVPYSEKLRASSKAIRLEDVHQDIDRSMRMICEWVGITWEACLLETTFDGKKWWNRPESPRVSGTSPEMVKNRYSHYFNILDSLRLKYLTRGNRKAWGYMGPESELEGVWVGLLFISLCLPFKQEWQTLNYRMSSVLMNLVNKYYAYLKKALGLPESWKCLIKLATILTIILITVPVILYFLLRDYIMIRYWLYRSWYCSPKEKREFVSLLKDYC